jgi:hypothetical protein
LATPPALGLMLLLGGGGVRWRRKIKMTTMIGARTR